MERKNRIKICNYSVLIIVGIVFILGIMFAIKKRNVVLENTTSEIPNSLLHRIGKEAEQENLFFYLLELQAGIPLSKEELYAYREEESLENLFLLEENKIRRDYCRYWKVDMDNDGVEDLIQLQKDDYYGIENTCFYKGNADGTFSESYIQNHKDSKVEGAFFISYEGKNYYILLRPAKAERERGMDIIEIYLLENGKIKTGMAVQLEWKDLKIEEAQWNGLKQIGTQEESEIYKELMEKIKEKKEDYLSYMNGESNVILGGGEKEVVLPEGIKENKASKAYGGWYESDLDNDGEQEYYQKEKKGFTPGKVWYTRKMVVNLLSEQNGEQFSSILSLYAGDDFDIKTFWVEEIRGKNILCILGREEKQNGIKIVCYLKEEKEQMKMGELSYRGVYGSSCKWQEKEGKKGRYWWEKKEQNAERKELKILQIGGLEDKILEEKINEVLWKNVMELETEGYEANFEGSPIILYESERYLCIRVEGKEPVEYPRKLDTDLWGGWKAEKNTQKMYLVLDLKEGKRISLDEIIEIEAFAEGLKKKEIPMIEKAVDSFQVTRMLEKWTEEEIKEELRECSIGEKEYLEERGEKKYTMKNTFFIEEGMLKILFEAYEETALNFQWEDIEKYLKVENEKD